MLNKITIKNYKSLENVTLTLRPFNVFIGPNNAGKSNIFDCLAFLCESLTPLQRPTSTVQRAVDARGGFQYVVWGGDPSRSISVDLDVSLGDPDGKKERRYNFYIEVQGNQFGTSVSAIRLRYKANSDWRMLLDVQRGAKGTAWDINGEELDRLQPRGDPEWWLGGLSYLTQAHWSFADYIRSWRFYNFVPSRMELPQPVKKDLDIQHEGENLSVVLHSLHSSYRDEFKEIEELARVGVGEIEELFTELTEQGQTYTTFKEQGVPLRIPMWAMSDGTLRLLAHLAAIYSPTPPPLMAFEEPENFIHPRRLELLADVLRGASKRSQILVATHSPHFLDYRRFDLDDLVIVEKAEGKTHCKKLSKQRQKGVKEALKVLTLGEMWYSGHLGGVP